MDSNLLIIIIIIAILVTVCFIKEFGFDSYISWFLIISNIFSIYLMFKAIVELKKIEKLTDAMSEEFIISFEQYFNQNKQ
ncbi:MAG: hypothetical protein DRG11_03115 [Epsilonproteobacteria bacterium]|nr:MAG: hypothetical protein DRG11_03115 [Campylobacterota bacterium]